MPAVGYRRESSKQSSVHQAYEFQLERLEGYGCKWIYGDRISGQRDDREGYREALAKIESGEADELVVTHLFRLVRSAIEGLRIVELLRSKGARLTILGGSCNTETPEGRAQLTMQLAMGQLEAELGAERQRIGWQNSRNKARPRATVFGYLIQDGRYVPDVEMWPVAEAIIEKYLELRSLDATMRWVWAEYGHLKERTRQNRPPFTSRGLKLWLLNPVLCGHVQFMGGAVRFLDQHPALMSRDRQKSIKSTVTSRVSGLERGGEPHPFAGLVWCGACGSRCAKLHLSESKGGYTYFRCSAARWNQCDQRRRIRAEAIEAAAINAIIDQAEAIGRSLVNQDAVVIANPEIELLQQQKDRLLPLLAIDPRLGDVVADLDQRIANLQQTEMSASPEKLGEALELMEAFKMPELWDGLTRRDKGRYLRALIKQIVVQDGAVVSVEFQSWVRV